MATSQSSDAMEAKWFVDQAACMVKSIQVGEYLLNAFGMRTQYSYNQGMVHLLNP